VTSVVEREPGLITTNDTPASTSEPTSSSHQIVWTALGAVVEDIIEDVMR
jgi:hypothetical protein